MKLNKKWIALMLLVCVAFALTACGEKKEEAKPAEAPKTIVGLWVVNMEESMIADGLSAEEAREYAASMGDAKMTYEFTADGRLIGQQTMYGETVTKETTYTLDGNNLNMGEGSSAVYKLEGDKLTIEGGDTFIMYRSK
mgnify:CR=1 FL=1